MPEFLAKSCKFRFRQRAGLKACRAIQRSRNDGGREEKKKKHLTNVEEKASLPSR